MCSVLEVERKNTRTEEKTDSREQRSDSRRRRRKKAERRDAESAEKNERRLHTEGTEKKNPRAHPGMAVPQEERNPRAGLKDQRYIEE
jgi:hypothetical protein